MRNPILPAAIVTFVVTTGAASANPVVDWNAITLRAAAAQGPLPQTRTLAIVHVAVDDAVSDRECRNKAAAEAAAIAAAHHALLALFPSQSAMLDGEYARSLTQYGIGPGDAGLAVGAAAAQRVLDARANDGASLAQFPYTPPGAGTPGVWVPTPPAFAPALLPGWGAVQPWALKSGSQFRPRLGPPPLWSRRFAGDLNEVKAIGAVNSSMRTAEQAAIARFWVASAGAIWNDVLRKVVLAKGLDVTDSARAFALMNVAGADAAIACWDAKFFFNFWRPVTAIRQLAEPSWEPLIPTPPFPEYPSGHAVISAAMGTMLGKLFGDEPRVLFTAESPTNPGFVRQWTRFSEGISEVIEARIYSGIHFRTADERGAMLGRRVARYVAVKALGATRKK